MKSRILLGEIPSREFHSAIFTTYSINLYYLEQQVLPLLGGKGIQYVSVLVDGDMLSSHLDSLSSLSDIKKRTYAINGMKCKGAFHSKLIFLAGDTTLLLLIGSGNLTSSGHGKNLEVWNAFYVENENDAKLGFLLKAWNYIKELHQDLGQSAKNKIRNIEDNCSLFKVKVSFSDSYTFDDDKQLSFLHAQPQKSIFNQLVNRIGKEEIERITVMSPFYDVDGKLIQLLNNKFKPKTINIILQKEFGNAPTDLKPTENMHFYDWKNVNCDLPQKFFHAKNVVFEGVETSFLLSGSANASIAAFGIEQKASANHEACVLYQSQNTDYISLLGLKLKKRKVTLSDYEHLNDTFSAGNSVSNNTVFIRSAESNYDLLSLQISLEVILSDVKLCVFDARGNLLFDKPVEIASLESKLIVSITFNSSVFYCFLMQGENIISNKQFITDIQAFESTNPSPKNRSLNELRKIIEVEGFSTIRIIDYLSQIFQPKAPIKSNTVASDKKVKADEIFEEDNALLYLSYEQVQEKAKHFDNSRNGRAYVEYQSVRLWESIISYLKDSKERNEQSRIDEEETEDINNSTGREDSVQHNKKPSISRLAYEKKRLSIDRCLSDYVKTLEAKFESAAENKPTIIDLSMYLIMLEILLQHITVIGKHKCSKNGKFECSVFGNNRAAVLSFKSTGCQ